jgi:hypothetical protein
LVPAFTAVDVEVWYMEGLIMDASNWGYPAAGLRIPEPKFLEGYASEEQRGVLELRLSFYFMVFGR